MKKIVSIVGARPQFIKYGALSNKLKENFDEILIHTGQHYDKVMSDLLFNDLNIPEPEYNLNIGSHSHGKQTALMLEGIENILLDFKPDMVLVFGDTNSTLAGALAASKLHIKLAHVEAGLRSFNKKMPEEINRILTDHCSDLLFCPTENAVNLLMRENITKGVHLTGDIMLDAFNENIIIANEKSEIIEKLGLSNEEYVLATLHRAENTDNPDKLREIINAFNSLNIKIVLPLHPRTKKMLINNDLVLKSHIKVMDPVGYLDMLKLLKNCSAVITDSGGLQKEAYFAYKPCITVRDETEWKETVSSGWNKIIADDFDKIGETFRNFAIPKAHPNFYGDGASGEVILNLLK